MAWDRADISTASKWVATAALALVAVVGATVVTLFIGDDGVGAAQYDGRSVSDVMATRFLDPATQPPVLGQGPRHPAAPMLSPFEFFAATSALEARTRPPASNPDAVFNEAQIAAIKSRLKLTADQDQHWAPLASALRAVTWIKPRNGRGAPVLNAESVVRLKQAADDFAVQLRADQKREVRLLANIVGLKIDL